MQTDSIKENLKKQVRKLEYLSISWEIIESSIAIIAGFISHSVSLTGFGLDSFIEIFASIIVLWQINHSDKKKEKVALRLIGSGYFLVAAYILVDAINSLKSNRHAETSLVGIVFLIATVAIMYNLAWRKRIIGRKLESKTIIAEANFSFVDGSLAAIVLIGLVLNTLFGWWWADDVMALLIAGFAIKEGIEEWSGGE